MQNILEALHTIDCHFRIEDDEEGFYFSIIDRGEYPRIWADNFQDGMIKVIAETTENLLNKTVLAGKDWIERFHGATIDECLQQVREWMATKEIPSQLPSPKKTANEILFEYGIDTMSLNDDFNTQLFHAMEEYANQFKGTTPAIITDQAALLEILNNLWKHGYDSNRKDNFYVNDYKKGAIEDAIKLLSKQNPSTPAVQDTGKYTENDLQNCWDESRISFSHEIGGGDESDLPVFKTFKEFISRFKE